MKKLIKDRYSLAFLALVFGMGFFFLFVRLEKTNLAVFSLVFGKLALLYLCICPSPRLHLTDGADGLEVKTKEGKGFILPDKKQFKSVLKRLSYARINGGQPYKLATGVDVILINNRFLPMGFGSRFIQFVAKGGDQGPKPNKSNKQA